MINGLQSIRRLVSYLVISIAAAGIELSLKWIQKISPAPFPTSKAWSHD